MLMVDETGKNQEVLEETIAKLNKKAPFTLVVDFRKAVNSSMMSRIDIMKKYVTKDVYR